MTDTSHVGPYVVDTLRGSRGEFLNYVVRDPAGDVVPGTHTLSFLRVVDLLESLNEAWTLGATQKPPIQPPELVSAIATFLRMVDDGYSMRCDDEQEAEHPHFDELVEAASKALLAAKGGGQ